FFLTNCGGVIGNIKEYVCYSNEQKLKSAVELVYKKNPNLIALPDTLNYGKQYDGKFYYNEKYKEYFIYIKDDKAYILNFCIIENDSLSQKSTIALLRGAEYGKTLDLESNISRAEKSKYKELFEKYFIGKMNIEIAPY